MFSVVKKKYQRDTALLTFVAAGSVDDGKSTLIGRLLFDLDQLYQDQIEAVRPAAQTGEEIDFSLFTDGLSSEREQKITIDVAYRYFATAKRRFIIADVPGHEEYTRNMATGASIAQAALILVDAGRGLMLQTKRHLFIATLLGIPHIAVVINKMDTVGYSEKIFEKIRKDCLDYAVKLQAKDLQFIPTSALNGDMVVSRGENMPWYGGRTVIDYLDNLEITGDRNLIDLRFGVQAVIKTKNNARGYLGSVSSGIIRVGEKVKILPSFQESVVKEIFVAEKKVEYAFSPQPAAIFLTTEVDVGRGDVLVRENNIAELANSLEAMICWFSPSALRPGARYLIKHTTNTTSALISRVIYKIDLESSHRRQADSLEFNDVGRVAFKTQKPLIFDPYLKNKSLGGFIIIDEETNNTVGAGTIIRQGKNGQKIFRATEPAKKTGVVLWFTGLSGAGKSTIADQVAQNLLTSHIPHERLDGDWLRQSLTEDFDFSLEGRKKNIQVAAFLAKTLSRHGILVLATFISPDRAQREQLKKEMPNFFEIYVKAPLEVCQKRDVKGLYKKAQAGHLEMLTGVSQDYEAPISPDLELNTDQESIKDSVQKVINFLQKNSLV